MADLMFTEVELRRCAEKAADAAVIAATGKMAADMQEFLLRAIAAERKLCIAACEAQRITDPCKGEEEAHERAIDHCVRAIGGG